MKDIIFKLTMSILIIILIIVLIFGIFAISTNMFAKFDRIMIKDKMCILSQLSKLQTSNNEYARTFSTNWIDTFNYTAFGLTGYSNKITHFDINYYLEYDNQKTYDNFKLYPFNIIKQASNNESMLQFRINCNNECNTADIPKQDVKLCYDACEQMITAINKC